eukprot:m51a1_g13183 hypothetical protein (222) ;mRNA; r:168-2049
MLYHWDDERSAAENAQFAAALARLTALERLWAEGMEAVLPQCTQLTFLHIQMAPCGPELLQSAVVPLAGLVRLELVASAVAEHCTDSFVDRGFQAVELELVGLCRDSLRTLEGGHPEAAQAALATCPLLRSLDVSALDNCVVRGFVERARAGLPAIDELPGLNKVNDCELPPGDSPEGRMLAHALRSIKIEGALEKVLRSLVALGCQRLEHLSCWLCLAHD